MQLDQPLPDAARLKLDQVIEDGHCGKPPPNILPGIVAAQRARDAIMAKTLQADASAVLIAGNGHVRRDFGVPHYLAHYPQGDDVRVVGFIEVDADQSAPTDYVPMARRNTTTSLSRRGPRGRIPARTSVSRRADGRAVPSAVSAALMNESERHCQVGENGACLPLSAKGPRSVSRRTSPSRGA